MGTETATAGRYLRIQARYCGRLGVEVGIFVAVDHLRRAGRLTPDELDTYLDIDDWFHEHLPEPSFYEDGNTIGAVTWFKNPAPPEMAERTQRLMEILHAHNVEHDLAMSDDPGEIVYEDDYQVGVIPTSRKPQTKMSDAATLGPTTAGSKRDLPHGPINT